MKRLLVIIVMVLVVIGGCEKETPNYPTPTVSFITDSGFVFTDITFA